MKSLVSRFWLPVAVTAIAAVHTFTSVPGVNADMRLSGISVPVIAERPDTVVYPPDGYKRGWTEEDFLMDARTGLGRFHDFRISNYDLMMELIDYCVNHSIDEVLALPDVKERVDLYFEQQELFKKQLEEVVKIEGKVAVIDLRPLETIYAGNRFMVYAMWPEVEISVHVAWGFKKQNTAVMIGKSIINKASNVDIGELCFCYGGGGHANAGTCQLDNDVVDGELPNIIAQLNGESAV